MKAETNAKTPDILVLGDHRYDRSTGRLEDARGKTVHLRHQSAQVLAVLATQPGQVVARDTLLDEVWPETATTDDSLVQCIADIRRALGRDAVQTFPKKGYCLRATEGRPAATTSGYGSRGHRTILMALSLVLVAALSLRTVGTATDDDAAIVPPPVASEFTLAVLPFANLGGDPDLRFFSDGLSEDLVTDLSKVTRLTVISPHSSFDYRDAERGFRPIAEDLGARYLVRGTVRHDGARVRINVSLVDPEGGQTLWAERYDRNRADPFGVQEDVAREIARALSLELGADPQPASRIEADAYYMLLRGLQPLRARTLQGNLEARGYFRKALELDPQYARAHANIAVTYGREVMFAGESGVGQAAIQRGLEAAVTAIQLDPAIPSAYFALGVLNLAIGEHDNALAAVRHAIRLDSNYSDAYALLAEIAVQGGDLGEALDAIRRAKLLHPHHPFSYDWVEGHILFQSERYEDAEPLLQAAADRSPLFLQGQITLAANLGREGKIESARSVLDEVARLVPDLSLTDQIERAAYRFDERREHLAESLRVVGWSP